MEPKFKQLTEFLGSKTFLMGNNMTIADFTMHDPIKWHMALDKSLIDANLQAYIARLDSEPKIKAFLGSDKAHKPFFSPIATWNGC